MKNVAQVVAGVALAMSATDSTLAGSIGLTATIRDFSDVHPDFEGVIAGVEPGAVSSTLGLDGKPVFAAGGAAFTTAANFDQWYRDVPGVNLSTPFSLTLTESVPGVYTYSNPSFFPIDGLLLGNEGRSHNYHFTLELHSSFTYLPGQTFSFTGDDDLWLFIDNSLVIDLGGVHSAASASVSLDTLGLTPGAEYDFDLFFAERHTTASSFTVETGIVLKPDSVPDSGSTLVLVALGGLALTACRSRK